MTISVNLSQFQKFVSNSKKAKDQIAQDAFNFFVKETPFRSGNARSRTKLTNKSSIDANYAYAQRLDEGWSKQSPDGMVQPTIDELNKTIVPRAIRRLNSGK